MERDNVVLGLLRVSFEAGGFVLGVVAVSLLALLWCCLVLMLTGRLPWMVRRYF